jgi:hypothetical protein
MKKLGDCWHCGDKLSEQHCYYYVADRQHTVCAHCCPTCQVPRPERPKPKLKPLPKNPPDYELAFFRPVPWFTPGKRYQASE